MQFRQAFGDVKSQSGALLLVYFAFELDVRPDAPDLFRRHAIGNFAALTKEVSRDPAMMIYLDLQQSRKEHPNENWARELMELFTVGIGNYSETDIRESARAFTGYRIDMTTQQFRFAPRQADVGPKTFMGKTGALLSCHPEAPCCG